MNKKEQKKQNILMMLRDLPLVSTTQVSMFFKESGSPEKRASEMLRSLEKEKLIEGKRREIGKSKIWRLSSNGRSQMKVRKRPMPMNSMKIDHALAIGDVWLTLFLTGKLQYFKYEPIDPFKQSNGIERVYSPDAFFIYDKKVYVLEVQRSNLSTLRWGDKWSVASVFFNEGHYKKATWQISKQLLKPQILVISTQSHEVIQGESNLELKIVREINELIKEKAPI